MRKLLLFISFISSSYAYSLPISVSVQEDQTFWIALFGLALIGIFALFLSSDQMKRINKKHDKMAKVQAEIQQKQQKILEFMSEKIETSTKGIILHKEVLRQNSFDSMTPAFFQEEMERFEKSEALLLDATNELVDFLQIKSGNLKVTDETYKLSNVLNETYGFISNLLKKSRTELVYDIEPELATELKGDSKRIEQVLSTLLVDIFHGMQNNVVFLKLSLVGEDEKRLSFELHNKSKKITPEEIETLFSNNVLKEKMDLYIAYELVKRMGGSLTAKSSKDEGTYYTVELPYHPQKAQSLLSVNSKGKRLLIIESEKKVGEAMANMIKQHEVDVDVHSTKNSEFNIPDLYSYDMIFVNTMLLSRVIFNKLEAVRNSKKCQVIGLHNIYDRRQLMEADKNLIDIVVEKPLHNEQIFNLLEKISDGEKSYNSSSEKLIALKETTDVTHDKFSNFSHVYVLIAEDNQMNQKILRGVLNDSGMKIIIVNNGKEALEEVKKNKEIDLVFMDTNMPTMDGYEATKKIREIYDEDHLPIVAISSVGFQNELDKMASAGANAFLHKPFKLGELYSAFSMYATEKQSKIKNINCKLTKYEGDKNILDIQKGISSSHTAIFYKEILQEVLVNMKDSSSEVETWISNREDQKIKLFVSDTLRLAETIGATSFVKTLKEINQLFDYKEESRLSEYLHLYKREWKKLQAEIEEYLKC